MICGIDEAGRGPVIGPMVMAGVIVEDTEKLKSLGVKDSKLLSRTQREKLYPLIIESVVSHLIIELDSNQIDFAVHHSELNLNGLEALTTAMIISHINPIPTEIIVDCPSNNISSYVSKIKQFLLKQKFIHSLNIKAEHKADVNYIQVSAASILAKVSRDWAVDKIKEKYQIECGSGYITDPKTKQFLKENYHNKEYDAIIRRSWNIKL